MFPDIESALCDLLQQFADTGTSTPSDLSGEFIRVNRFGGPDDGVTDRARVDIDCFAPKRGAAFALSNQVRAFLASGHHVVDGVVIDLVSTEAGPTERPVAGGHVRRFGTTHTVSARRS